MKKLILAATAVAAALTFGTFNAAAEVTECIEITSVPTIISSGGVYCLKQNLGTSLNFGPAISIEANNVTIEMNGFRLGGLSAGLNSQASGIVVQARRNVTIRNGTIRGFQTGVRIIGSFSQSSGHLIEKLLIEQSRSNGIRASGLDMIMRDNRIYTTGPSGVNDAAIGIWVDSGANVIVENNVIAGVEETSKATGIIVQSSGDVEVSRNRLSRLSSTGTSVGITVGFSSDVILEQNVVLGDNGSTGIENTFSEVNDLVCINNRVGGFTTNIGGCDVLSGNVLF